MLMPISLFGQAVNGNGKEGSAFPMPEQTGAAASPMPEASPTPWGTLQSKDEPSIGGAGTGLGKRKAEQNFNRAGYSIKKENSVFRQGIREKRAPQSKLEQLAREDTNIAALLGWGLVPRIEDGKLKLKGAAKLSPEALDGLKRWLAHIGHNGETRRERVIRALTTGRKAC